MKNEKLFINLCARKYWWKSRQCGLLMLKLSGPVFLVRLNVLNQIGLVFQIGFQVNADWQPLFLFDQRFYSYFEFCLSCLFSFGMRSSIRSSSLHLDEKSESAVSTIWTFFKSKEWPGCSRVCCWQTLNINYRVALNVTVRPRGWKRKCMCGQVLL